MRRLTLIGLCLFVGWSGAFALESDQFYAWGRELADATEILNAKVRLEIRRAVTGVNENDSWRRMECHDVVAKIVPRFRQFIFQDFELWTTNSSLVPRIPATPAEELSFRKHYLYRDTGPFDLGTKVPPSPTIEVAGVRMGTDKLSHFFSEGWMYFGWYRSYRKAGRSVEEAERRTIRRGIIWEKTILGLVSSGVFSRGDLEANYQGMRFLLSLCEGDAPGLQRTDDGWRYADDFDFRDHVLPEWDESYHPPVFGKRRWKRVRPALIAYCAMLDDPSVIRRRREYARRDRETPTERIVRSLVEAGKLPDPRRFAIENNCPPETMISAHP